MLRFTPKPLYPWKEYPVPSPQETGWAPEPVWRFWRTNFLPCQDLNPKHPAHGTAAIPNEPSNFLQQCGCDDISLGKVSTWFLSAGKVNGGKRVLMHHGPPHNICMLHIPVTHAKYFIHDTNHCTLQIIKYNSLSLPQVLASFMPSSGSFRRGFITY
jgi:hypothetical protein